ncbi:MAG TPA: ABC transporter ATP-binding protein [Polyangiaceae bacterium]
MKRLTLPDYREHPPFVQQYFSALKSRRKVLSIENVTRCFDDGKTGLVALDRISFDVHHREFLSVIGPSGCGKSTLVRILSGLDYPTSGTVAIDGIPVSGPGADRGMVFQNHNLFPWLTVKGNVMFGPSMKGMPKARAERMALDWIEMVGLSEFADAYPAQLSGGMSQRVAIARALANCPQVLLMDEPFGALDAQTRADMQSHLLRICKDANVTVLFITHDLDEAIYLSDRIVVLGARPGRVAEIIEVPVERPRTPDQFLSEYFLATKLHLEQLIHQREISTKPTAAMLAQDGN